MIKINKMKKFFAAFSILTIVLMTIPVGNIIEAGAIALKISAPSNYNVKEKDSLSFTLTFSGDIADIDMINSDVALEGFKADIEITGTGNIRTLNLKNVEGIGTGKRVRISGGIGISSTGAVSNAVNSALFNIVAKDSIAPKLVVSNPNPSQVYVGGTVSYVLTFTDNVGVIDIDMIKQDIALQGFTADVAITGSGLSARTVTLSNIQGSIGGGKYIKVSGGIALDAEGNVSNSANAPVFVIAEKPVDPVVPDPDPIVPDPVVPKPNPEPEKEKPTDWIKNPNTGR
ncbi:MAG: hypothetical protein RSB67_01185 [Clostridia bacterium]